MSIRHTIIPSELDNLTLVAEGDALAGLYFEDHWTGAHRQDLGPLVDGTEDAVLAEATRQLREYLSGERTGFDIPVISHGSDFEERVWARLKLIPWGERITYGDIAAELGGIGFSQQVGQAVGHNPIGIVVPCHRVVGAGGKLVGYAGGLERKQWLLNHERPWEMRNARLF